MGNLSNKYTRVLTGFGTHKYIYSLEYELAFPHSISKLKVWKQLNNGFPIKSGQNLTKQPLYISKGVSFSRKLLFFVLSL